MAPKAPDSNALSGVGEGVLEDVERLLRGSRDLEARSGAAVLDRNRQCVRDTAPQERDLDAVRRAVMNLCECRFGHGFTVAVGGIARHRANRHLWVRSAPVLIGGNHYSLGSCTPSSARPTSSRMNATPAATSSRR